MFMQHNQVRDVVRATRLRELLHDVVSAVDAVRVREYQPHLLRELEQARARVARRRDQYFRVQDPRARILVVDVRRRI